MCNAQVDLNDKDLSPLCYKVKNEVDKKTKEEEKLVAAKEEAIQEENRCSYSKEKIANLTEEGLNSTTVGDRLDYFNAAIGVGVQAMFVCESEIDKDVLEKGLNDIGTYVNILNQMERSQSIPKAI